MRCLERDKRRVLIGRFVGLSRVVDDQGRFTGRNEPGYAKPVEFWPTVSPVRGEAEGDYFGQRVDYDLTLTVDDPAFEVKEADILWVDELDGEPGGVRFVEGRDGLGGSTFEDWDSDDDADGGSFPDAEGEPNNYIVRRVARTGSFTVIAAKKVDVSA